MKKISIGTENKKKDGEETPRLRLVEPKQLSTSRSTKPIERPREYKSHLAKHLDAYLDNLEREVQIILKS